MLQLFEPTFQNIIRWSTHRWLNQIQLNPGSRTYGCADREYWAWKIKDFPNGTWQGGLSGFLDSKELIDLSEQEIESICIAVIKGTRFIQRSNGSFEEAYPRESSYAVTGLVLFELLYSRLRYPKYFSKCEADFTLITGKARAFLEKAREGHGLIANHICTTVTALEMYDFWKARQSWRPSKRLLEFLVLINSEEGWFPEYGGADPGYQTLLNSYLIRFLDTVNSNAPEIRETLKRSLEFCSLFCYPTGAFAGEIGSRGTSIVYPAGLIGSETKLATWFFSKYMANIGGVQPLTVDDNNFVPLFNSWSYLRKSQISLPVATTDHGENHFVKAGLFVKRDDQTHLVVSARTGAVKLFTKQNDHWREMSTVGLTKAALTSQCGRVERIDVKAGVAELKIALGQRNEMLNSAWKSTVLRAIGFLAYWLPAAQVLMKQIMARVVMRPQKGHGQTTVKIDLKTGRIEVEALLRKKLYGYDLHMASANYFPQSRLYQIDPTLLSKQNRDTHDQNLLTQQPE
jgi:hypothetical protein